MNKKEKNIEKLTKEWEELKPIIKQKDRSDLQVKKGNEIIQSILKKLLKGINNE